jgi:predicted dinucleotide-utilizing enzyme
MQDIKKIGIIGYGKIGSYVANRINDEKKAKIVFIHDKDQKKLEEASKKFPTCLKEEIINKSKECDLVLESANFEAVKEHIEILKHTNFMICSISALFYYDDLKKLAEETMEKSHLYIPHGAIVGLDGLDLFEKITITTAKSPRSLIKYPERKSLEELGIKGKVYSGDVVGACKNFPLNVNVHAAIAIIAGADKVTSVIEAYEGGNEHIIEGTRKNEKIYIRIKSNFSERTSGHVPESIYNSLIEVLRSNGIKRC